MHCLIIDDNETRAKKLEQSLKSHTGASSIHGTCHPSMVRSLLSMHLISVVFIRVSLWDHTLFKNMEKMPMVVFISSYHMESFHLREPYTVPDIHSLWQKLETSPVIEDLDFFFVKHGRCYRKIRFDSVELIEKKSGNYVQLFTADGNFMVAGTLNCWLIRLPNEKFVRISDTLIVPVKELPKLIGSAYDFKGRQIPLTYQFV